MQYILSEKEMNRGHDLLLSWTTEKYTINEVYVEAKKLQEQGFYTYIIDDENDTFRIMVFKIND